MTKAIKKAMAIILTTTVFLFSPITVKRTVNAFSPLEIIAENRSYIFYPPELSVVNGEFVLNGIDDVVERIYLDCLINPTNAQLSFTPDKAGNFCFESEKSGKRIDKNLLKKEILYALDCGKRKVTAKTQAIPPDVTVDYLMQETAVRGKYSTVYSSSSPERKHNIELACKSLNGAIIDLYGDFSFNERVGERSEKQGYKVAKIISEGKFTDGLGGGVCQVSTTLYNAALRAGLTITEYHRHSLAVSYVPPSFDAMVSGGYCDLRINNSTSRKVYIKAQADGERVTITIFGIANEIKYKFRSSVDEIIPARIRKADKESGEMPVLPKDGIKSSAYMEVYKDGELISTKKIRSDFYAPIDGVITE